MAARPVPGRLRGDEDVEVEGVVAESLKVPARVWHAAIDGVNRAADRAALGQIVAPTLLLWGEHDAYFSLAEQVALGVSAFICTAVSLD